MLAIILVMGSRAFGSASCTKRLSAARENPFFFQVAGQASGQSVVGIIQGRSQGKGPSVGCLKSRRREKRYPEPLEAVGGIAESASGIQVWARSRDLAAISPREVPKYWCLDSRVAKCREDLSRPSRGDTWQRVEPSRHFAHRDSSTQRAAPLFSDARGAGRISGPGPRHRQEK
jgi:hypothetical protein